MNRKARQKSIGGVRLYTFLSALFACAGLLSVAGCPQGPQLPGNDDHSNTWSGATALPVSGGESGRTQPAAGTIETSGDEDFFYFVASAGCSYTIATGGSIDTYLYLYGSDGSTQLASNDDGGVGTLSLIRWDAQSSGPLYVMVRHYSSGTGSYTVSVTESDCGTRPDDDHADSSSGATSIGVGGTSIAGTIEAAGDEGYFSFAAQAGCTYTIETGGSMDTYLHLYGPDGGTELASNDDGGSGTLSLIAWEATSSGTHYVKVRHYSSSGTGSYTVRVTESGCGGSGSRALIINSDTASNHVARVINDDGTEIDCWVQRTSDGSIDYVSDFRVTYPDGGSEYVQVDVLGRVTYYEDSAGYSFRVHFYLTGNQADVTYSAPDGSSVRTIVDLSGDLGGVPRVRYDSLDKDYLAGRMQDGDYTGTCAAIQDGIEVVCTASTVIGVIQLFGCAASVTADLLLAGPTGEGIAGCVWSFASGAAISTALCGTADWLLSLPCDSVVEDQLGEPEAPHPPSGGGDSTLGTGTVHITLTWDNATDVDLHVTDPFGEEIYYLNRSSASGGELDVDDIDGHGPENIYWPEYGAPSGQYTVDVHYYNDYGYGSAHYDVVVRYPDAAGEQVINTYSGTLSGTGDEHTVTTFVVSE